MKLRIRDQGYYHSNQLLLESVPIYDLPVKHEVLAKKSTGEIYDKLSADPRAKGFIEKYGRLMQVEIDSLDPNLLIKQVTRLTRKEIKAEIERLIMAGKRLILSPVLPYKGKKPLTLRDWLRGDKKLRWKGRLDELLEK